MWGDQDLSLSVMCRAEKSFTHRHLCEFTGLDLEMAINEHYNEVLDVLDRLFVYMFSGLKSRCGWYSCPQILPNCRRIPTLVVPILNNLLLRACVGW